MPVTTCCSGVPTVGTTVVYTSSGTTTQGTPLTAGFYQLFIDITPIAAGDEFLIQVIDKCRSSDAGASVIEEWYLEGVQSGGGMAAHITPIFLLYHAGDFTLKKVAGTDRSLNYNVRRVQ